MAAWDSPMEPQNRHKYCSQRSCQERWIVKLPNTSVMFALHLQWGLGAGEGHPMVPIFDNLSESHPLMSCQLSFLFVFLCILRQNSV